MGHLIDTRSHSGAGDDVESGGVSLGGLVVHLVCTPLVGCDRRCWRHHQNEAHFTEDAREIGLRIERRGISVV